MRKFKDSEVEYTLEIIDEDMSVRGNVQVSGDDADDKLVEDQILNRLENGETWAWCIVKVTATWHGVQGTNYLGGCSYTDEKEFKHPDGYYEDMKAQALSMLKQNIREMQSRVCGVKVA